MSSGRVSDYLATSLVHQSETVLFPPPLRIPYSGKVAHFAVPAHQQLEDAAHGRRGQSVLAVSQPTLDPQSENDAVVTEGGAAS